MSSTDIAPSTADAAEAAADAEAEALLERAGSALGEALVGSHISAGELWLRVDRESWADLAGWLRDEEGFTFFSFLSAIDWMPSPFGR
ncbi:MAG: hypothetical protein F4Z26_04940, partial [Acidimicrobiaceae bacterium]|nr:hypothetical protein [Acidimicrobiaceae bacterium]